DGPRRLELGPELADLRVHLGEHHPASLPLCLELQYPLDAGEVDSILLGQPLHLAEHQDVPERVAPASAGRPARRDQAEPVVGTERLRVQPGQLSGNGEHVYGRVVGQPEVVVHVVTPSGRLAPGCGACAGHHAWPFRSSSSLGSAPVVASLNFSRACRAASLSSVGTCTSTLTSRSPIVASDRRTPLPRTLNVRPFGVPGGIRRLTGWPRRTGTLMSAPSAASVKVTGTVTVRL